MRPNLLIALLFCFFYLGSYAQEELQNQKNQLSPQAQKKSDNATFSISLRKVPKKDNIHPVTKQDASLLKQTKVQTTQRKPTSPAVTSSSLNFSRAQKLPSRTPIINAKTTAEEIVAIEQEIVEVSASNASNKDLKLEKLEKILEKKKLTKFKEDQLGE